MTSVFLAILPQDVPGGYGKGQKVLMFIENFVQGNTVTDDHIVRREKCFGQMTAIRAGIYKNVIVMPTKMDTATMDKDFFVHDRLTMGVNGSALLGIHPLATLRGASSEPNGQT